MYPDPDLGGLKTCGSGSGFRSGSTTPFTNTACFLLHTLPTFSRLGIYKSVFVLSVLFLMASWKSMTKTAWSGSESKPGIDGNRKKFTNSVADWKNYVNVTWKLTNKQEN